MYYKVDKPQLSYPISAELLALLEKELEACEGNNSALARKIGIDPSYLHKYLRGTVKSVYTETWIKLCRFFPEPDPEGLMMSGNTFSQQPFQSYCPVMASELLADNGRQSYIPPGEYVKNKAQALFSGEQGGRFYCFRCWRADAALVSGGLHPAGKAEFEAEQLGPGAGNHAQWKHIFQDFL